jgi:hypothetical protein
LAKILLFHALAQADGASLRKNNPIPLHAIHRFYR